MPALDVARIVNVQVNMSPKAVPTRNFGLMCILGNSGVIPSSERMRTYNNISDVGEDFGVNDPEYQAAAMWFSQRPQPSQLAIAGWETSGVFTSITGAPYTFAAADWTGTTAGGFAFTLNGTSEEIGGLDFSAVANANDVVAVLNTALQPLNMIASYDGVSFKFQSNLQGVIPITALTAPSTGTDISGLPGLGMGFANNPAIVIGSMAETIVSAVQNLLNYAWYGLFVCGANSDILQIATLIEAASPSRILAVNTDNPATLVGNDTASIAYILKQSNLMKTLCVYSSTSSYAAVSYMARIMTTDFRANNTVITMKFKQLPTVIAEQINSSQADALKAKNCNVFVTYNNDTNIVQEGVMCNGYYTDEVYGLDWLSNAVQAAYYNVLYGATKVPQTEAGLAVFTIAVSQVLDQAVANGLVAGGVWNAPGFGTLAQGNSLQNGYYTYTPPISSQTQADRDARIAPTMQIAVKLSGAIHFGSVIINVNR